MEFTPTNPIVKLCLQGMALEAKDQQDEARAIFLQAWDATSNDFEKFIVAYYLARHQATVADKLQWLETDVQLALKIDNEAVQAAFPLLYTDIATCYEELGNPDKAKENYDLAKSFSDKPSDAGPFYHGTKADLQLGDLLNPGNKSNYSPDIIMNHIYFTAIASGAGLAASLAKGDGRERVYIVEPTGAFENDPNVTNQKFPGNPTRSYRTDAPLKIVGEVTDWARQTPEELQKWRERLDNTKGEIIN